MTHSLDDALVEKVARAIYESIWTGEFEDGSRSVREQCLQAARAALEAAGVAELQVQAETYQQMHETAKELGYPSILEALEAVAELREDNERLREALVDLKKLAMDDHWGTPKVCWAIIERIDAALTQLGGQAQIAALNPRQNEEEGIEGLEGGFCFTPGQSDCATLSRIAGLKAAQRHMPPDPNIAIPMVLICPACGGRHIDEGAFATKPHHTHACQHCGIVWRPAIGPTVGVQFLPGFKNEGGAKQ